MKGFICGARLTMGLRGPLTSVRYLLPKRKQQCPRESGRQGQHSPITNKVCDDDKQWLKAIEKQKLQIPSSCSLAWPNQLHEVNILC